MNQIDQKLQKPLLYSHEGEEILSPYWICFCYCIPFGLVVFATMSLVMFCYIFGIQDIYWKYHINAHQSFYPIMALFSIFYFYPLYRYIRVKGMVAFSGMSFCIFIFLVLFYWRMVTDSYLYKDEKFYAYLWLITLFTIIFPSYYFSIPLSKKLRLYVFYGVIISLSAVTVLSICCYSSFMLQGMTAKSPTLMYCFDSKEWYYIHRFRAAGMKYSFMLAVCSAWAMCYYKTPSIIYWIPLYIIGIVGGLWGASRSFLIFYFVAHVSIFLTPGLFKNKRKLLIVLCLFLTINPLLFVFVGWKDREHTSVGRFLNNIYNINNSLVNNSSRFSKTESAELINEINKVYQSQTIAPESINETNNISRHETADGKLAGEINNIHHSETADRKFVSEINNIHHSETANQKLINATDICQENNHNSLLSWQTFFAMDRHRAYLMLEGLKRIDKHLSIFGYSYFFTEGKVKKSMASPHNFLIQIVMGLGIVGSILFSVIVCVAMRDAIFTIRKTPELGWLGVLYIGFAIFTILFGFPIWNSYFLWLPMIALRANTYQYKKQLLPIAQ